MLCRAVVHAPPWRRRSHALRFYGLLLDDFGAAFPEEVTRRSLRSAIAPHTSQRVFAHEALLIMLYGACWLIGRHSDSGDGVRVLGAGLRVPIMQGIELRQPNTAITFDSDIWISLSYKTSRA
jgi:hypothetical protein